VLLHLPCLLLGHHATNYRTTYDGGTSYIAVRSRFMTSYLRHFSANAFFNVLRRFDWLTVAGCVLAVATIWSDGSRQQSALCTSTHQPYIRTMALVVLLLALPLTGVLGFDVSSRQRGDSRGGYRRCDPRFVSSPFVSTHASGNAHDDTRDRQSSNGDSNRWPSYPSVPTETTAFLTLGLGDNRNDRAFAKTEPLTAERTTVSGLDTPPTLPRRFETPISDFASFAHYFKTLESQDGIVVVLYAAAFCKLCQRATMVYKQIAAKRQEAGPRLKFYRLEVTTGDGHYMKPLQISKFPFVQIFYQHECVASFSTGPSHQFRKKVDDTLDVCVKRTPEDWGAVRQNFRSEIEENRRVRKELMARLLHP
jgi:Thioredoxin